MIIVMPFDNSIVKWKNDDKDEWKIAEISDLINAYERQKGEWIEHNINVPNCTYYQCSVCGGKFTTGKKFCGDCGAKMKDGGKEK